MDADALRELLESTVVAIDRAGIPDEALATLKKPRFSAPKFVSEGRAWRLGVLLIDRQARLYRTGEVTRAVEPLRGVANKSAEAEARRELRRAAARGKFPEGEVVNFGHSIIEVTEDSDPVRFTDGAALVRWNSSGHWRPLAGYLTERISLAQE
ncbi:MAG: hypothetical protein ACOH19_00225 [Rhodoglobus sp.]